MRTWRLARQAVAAMWAHKMYAVLMMIGLIIGISSVTVIIDIGQGARSQVVEMMTRFGFGANSFMIRAGAGKLFRRRGSRPTTMKMRDVEAISQFTFAKYVVPHRSVRGKRFIYGRTSTDSRLIGASEDFAEARDWKLKAGRFLTKDDLRRKARVVVLGTTVVRNLFGDQDPLGRSIRIGPVFFRVVGVLESMGSTPGGWDRDDMAVAPVTTVLRRVLNSDYISMIKVNLTSPELVPAAIKAVTQVLRKNHKLAKAVPDDFTIITADQLLNWITRQSRAMVLMLALIAGISLFVSGIVIMNIMLVSVSERKQEIGVRRSVGAKRRDIMVQFVLESLFVALAGGVLGIVLGQIISRLLKTVFGLPTAPSIIAVVLAMSFAGAVGLFFGIFPARRAAQLSPVEAVA
ncbi:MAG: ABC transporter permease [Proteobacteria bacterium]|nr:ABC transporter permease [Pseudomonadota bacterium]MBU1742657.1 ABC transporter permease [Pseudomonadota bacterium]